MGSIVHDWLLVLNLAFVAIWFPIFEVAMNAFVGSELAFFVMLDVEVIFCLLGTSSSVDVASFVFKLSQLPPDPVFPRCFPPMLP